MIRKIIIEALDKYKDTIMQFTLGDIADEDGVKYCDIYEYEWGYHGGNIINTIETIISSSIPLKPDIIVGIIISEWFECVNNDIEDLDYYGLLDVAIKIIDYIERHHKTNE